MNVLSRSFLALGLALCAAALCLSLAFRDAAPTLLRAPDAVPEQAAALMDAVRGGDQDTVRSLLYGAPDLGMDAASPVSQALQAAYWQSLSYTLAADCRATDRGTALDVTVTALDLPAVLEDLTARMPDLLAEKAAQSGDPAALLDEDGGYTEDFLLEVLDAALADIQPLPYVTQTLPLDFVYDQGQWRVLPEQALLNVISGVSE